MTDTLSAGSLVFGLGDVIQILLFAFACGGLWMQVSQHGKRLDTVESNHTKLQDQFLDAIKDLGQNIGELTTELKTVLAVHETRLNNIEKGS